MSENQELDLNQEDTQMPSEAELLKQRCKTLGIPVKGNPSVSTLKNMIEEHTSGLETARPVSEGASKNAKYAAVRKEALKLIRVSINCLNPNKNDWQGEIISAGNKAIGTTKKFIPFKQANHPDGYHVPKIIVDVLKARRYQAFKTVKHSNGQTTSEPVSLPEFQIVELPPLTEKELAELKAAQAARAGSTN